jgi:hypothetical protein
LTADFLGLSGVYNPHVAKDRHWWTQVGCIFYPLLALLLYLWRRDPKAMVIFGGFFQAATLPILAGSAVFLRYRRTDPRLAPSRWSDACLWLAFFSITAVAMYAIPHWALHDLFPLIQSMTAASPGQPSG